MNLQITPSFLQVFHNLRIQLPSGSDLISLEPSWIVVGNSSSDARKGMGVLDVGVKELSL
jgi:hypothetical protein